MIQVMEKYDLQKMRKEIDEDLNYQHPDESQDKNIPQQTITELMIENLKRKQRKHD